MTTKEKILTATGDELSRVLGEVLQPEHSRSRCGDCIYHKRGNCPTMYVTAIATICDQFRSPHDIRTDDWNVAMRWRDWAVAEYGATRYGEELHLVYRDDAYVSNHITWLEVATKPHHHLRAAARCKLEAEK